MWSHYDGEICRVPGTFMAKRGQKKPKDGGYGARLGGEAEFRCYETGPGCIPPTLAAGTHQ